MIKANVRQDRLPAGQEHRRSCATRTGTPSTRLPAGVPRHDRRGRWATRTRPSRRRQILSGTEPGQRRHAPPPPISSCARRSTAEGQIVVRRRGGNRYVALNTTMQAVQQRQRAQGRRRGPRPQRPCALTRGGPVVGDDRHALPAARHARLRGGRRRWRAPAGSTSSRNPSGDPSVARDVHEEGAATRAGSTPGQQILMVGDNADAGERRTAQIVPASSQKLGFKREVPLVDAQRRCTRSSATSRRPNVDDLPERRLAPGLRRRRRRSSTPTFNGEERSCPSNNSNWPQLNDPTDQRGDGPGATGSRRPGERAKAWGNDRPARSREQAAGGPVDLGQAGEHRLEQRARA